MSAGPVGSGDARLLVACASSLVLIVALIGWLRLTPFLAILLGALLLGFGAGMPPAGIMQAFQQGAGSLLGQIGLVIALGALLGGLVMRSGAADRIVSALLRPGRESPLPPRLLPWLVVAAAMIVGLPLFFEVGLVIMLPIILAIARESRLPVLRIAIPALAGMTTLHALVPPHPGPLIAIAALHADLGATLLLGLAIALPAAILAGPLYGNWLSGLPGFAEAGRHGTIPDRPETGHGHPALPAPALLAPSLAPSLTLSLSVMLLPVALMLGRTVAALALPPGSAAAHVLGLVGEPAMALTLSVLFAIGALGWARGESRETVGRVLHDSLPPIAVLLLTIGAGGGLKQVLLDAGIGGTIGRIAAGAHVPPILLGWGIAACLRQATGSATVATATTAGLVAPLMAGLGAGSAQTALMALAIGSGSVFFCHVNDAGFWMVNQFFGLSLKQTLMVWSVLQTIVSLTGLLLTGLLWWGIG